MMDNPLLDHSGLPRFSDIRPEHVVPAIDQLLADNRRQIQQLLENDEPYSWDSLIQPLEDLNERLNRTWSPVGHLNSVVNNDELRVAYNACLPKISDNSTEIGQNEQLFQAYQAIADGPQYEQLDIAQRKIIDNALRDFHLSGIDLNTEDKATFKAIMQELATLTARFAENILDATNAWNKLITDRNELAGLPGSALAMAQQTAQQTDKEGWLFTLEFPSYIAVMTYADNRDLRFEMYQAFATRASDEGPHGGRWDNTPLMEQILKLRHEEANLLGFHNYCERSLATKMASSAQQVMDFLSNLAERTMPMAKKELDELKSFAMECDGVDTLEAWDVTYYAEKLRQHKFNITQEEIKPYFPENRVLSGLFSVVERLYGLQVTEITGVDTWHEDVRFFEIRDAINDVCGQFYLDLYARPNKRGGAWMDECIIRKRRGSGIQIPVAYLTCNFSAPIGNDPALFNHSEVLTLFHEFGHGLHHMLTKVDYASVSGINGVPWDAVELPSQFMENWCWEREALDLIAGHYKTGETLPDTLFNKMLAARNFQSGMQMLRQLEFAIFDFRLHLEYNPDKGARVFDILDEVRQQVAVLQPPSFNRFPHSFSHIFAGGYAAGYYSYKWAEVLSSDAFSLFEEQGIFNKDIGKKFLSSILEKGGTREPMELFIEFRGREPQVDALLRHSGIAA